MLSTIDIVAEEEIVRFGGKSSVLEKSEEIIILSMNVTYQGTCWEQDKSFSRLRTTYFNGCFEFQQDGLVDEDVTGSSTEIFDFVFLKLDGLPGAISSDWQGER